MSAAALQTCELAIGYRRRRKGQFYLAQNLNLRLEAGTLVGLLGPNGVGKSTLLRVLAALQAPLAGRVLLDGADARRMTRGQLAQALSLVLTHAPQPSMMTGYELVALGRLPHSDWMGKLGDADRQAIAQALDAVKAGELARQALREMSDGQRQKLMIARALAQQTAIMLLDEPTAFLDLPHRVEIMRLLKRLARQTRRAMLISTHDLDLALRSCDQLWLMREGSMLVGAPEDLALEGGIAATFRGDGMRFDAASGAFASDSPAGAAIHVQGAGLRETWMRRALERNGYRTDAADLQAQICLQENGQAAEWRLSIGQDCSRHATVAAVLAALKDAGL